VKLTDTSRKMLKLTNKNKEQKREILKKTKKDVLLKLESSYFDKNTKKEVTTTVGNILESAKDQIRNYKSKEKSKTVVKYVVVFIDQYFIAEEIKDENENERNEGKQSNLTKIQDVDKKQSKSNPKPKSSQKKATNKEKKGR